jgi:hypothetical protein
VFKAFFEIEPVAAYTHTRDGAYSIGKGIHAKAWIPFEKQQYEHRLKTGGHRGSFLRQCL